VLSLDYPRVPDRHEYCTIFDRRYLVRSLALYRSLERSDPQFVLRAVCMDSVSSELLRRLSLSNLRIIPIEQIEESDPELRSVRAERSSWEYCWTATPAVCRYFLDTEPDVELLTYLDADLFIWSSPAPLFAELANDSILLIPHRGPSKNDEECGVYNVGWITFRNDARGRAAVRWWRERCLEWCYDRIEPGRFGDQKYLDDLPTRFEGVRVSGLTAAGLGPWNDSRYELSAAAKGRPPLVGGEPLIYYHHTGIQPRRAAQVSRWLGRLTGDLELYEGPVDVMYTFSSPPPGAAVRELVWRPYMAALTAALGELIAVQAPPRACLYRASRRLTVRHSLQLPWQLLKRLIPVRVAPASS
jgi:hypothetical protein